MKWKPYTYLLKCPNGKYYYGVKYGKKKPNIANPDKYKTKGSRSSKITYFINNYYIEKFKDLLVKSKNPKAVCRRILMKHYENEYVYT